MRSVTGVTAASFGCRPEQLSLLAFAAHVHGCGGLADLIGVRDGALTNRIAGGAGTLPAHLARHLGDRVRLDHPVVEVQHSLDRVPLISHAHRPVHARRVIVAMDPATANCIAHHPPLPYERAEDYVEQDWTTEPWQTGCVPRVPTGVLHTGQPWLTRPAGPVHWAGAESSHVGEAHMDGAVRAGQRAADEVLATLATTARA